MIKLLSHDRGAHWPVRGDRWSWRMALTSLVRRETKREDCWSAPGRLLDASFDLQTTCKSTSWCVDPVPGEPVSVWPVIKRRYNVNVEFTGIFYLAWLTQVMRNYCHCDWNYSSKIVINEDRRSFAPELIKFYSRTVWLVDKNWIISISINQGMYSWVVTIIHPILSTFPFHRNRKPAISQYRDRSSIGRRSFESLTRQPWSTLMLIVLPIVYLIQYLIPWVHHHR